MIAALAIPTVAAAECPALPGNVFAFLALDSKPASKCPSAPIVRWADPRVLFECGFFADGNRSVPCGGADCVALCRAAAQTWSTDLAGRFAFVDAGATPVGFCDPNDGRTSIGGSTTVCDGSAFNSDTLAVTFRINLVGGTENGHLVDADITLNQAFADFFARDSKRFRATVGHELGHVTGLDHPDQCVPPRNGNVLMNSFSILPSSDPCFVVTPTSDDVAGARTIYPQIDPTPVCGDADGNGTVTVTDGVQVLRAAAELSSSCTPARCDVDGNGSVTVTDGVNVLRGAAGLSFPTNCPG